MYFEFIEIVSLFWYRVKLRLEIRFHSRKPIWVARLPAPKVNTHLSKASLSLPSELLLSEFGTRVARCNVPNTTFNDLIWNWTFRCGSETLNHLKHREALSSAQVEHFKAIDFARGETIQCRQMSIGKIDDMDIITNACSIMCWIIVTKHSQLLEFAHGNLCDIWHEIVWLSIGILADSSTLVRADRIKVSQRDHSPTLIRRAKIFHYFLGKVFRLSIGIRTVSSRMVFGQGQELWITVNGRR